VEKQLTGVRGADLDRQACLLHGRALAHVGLEDAERPPGGEGLRGRTEGEADQGQDAVVRGQGPGPLPARGNGRPRGRRIPGGPGDYGRYLPRKLLLRSE
jgi:hypothetical protein